MSLGHQRCSGGDSDRSGGIRIDGDLLFCKKTEDGIEAEYVFTQSGVSEDDRIAWYGVLYQSDCHGDCADYHE